MEKFSEVYDLATNLMATVVLAITTGDMPVELFDFSFSENGMVLAAAETVNGQPEPLNGTNGMTEEQYEAARKKYEEGNPSVYDKVDLPCEPKGEFTYSNVLGTGLTGTCSTTVKY